LLDLHIVVGMCRPPFSHALHSSVSIVGFSVSVPGGCGKVGMCLYIRPLPNVRVECKGCIRWFYEKNWSCLPRWGWGGWRFGRGRGCGFGMATVGSLEGVGRGDWIIILMNILKSFIKTQTFHLKPAIMLGVVLHCIICWNMKKKFLELTPDKENRDRWYSVVWGKGGG
jgi:hypothetical protein